MVEVSSSSVAGRGPRRSAQRGRARTRSGRARSRGSRSTPAATSSCRSLPTPVEDESLPASHPEPEPVRLVAPVAHVRPRTELSLAVDRRLLRKADLAIRNAADLCRFH